MASIEFIAIDDAAVIIVGVFAVAAIGDLTWWHSVVAATADVAVAVIAAGRIVVGFVDRNFAAAVLVELFVMGFVAGKERIVVEHAENP